MDDYSIDASLGLDMALGLLARERLNGELRASISQGFLRKTTSQYVIQVVDGQIVSCFRIEQRAGEQHAGEQRSLQISVSQDMLIQLDQRKGPFAWSFHPRHIPPQPQSSALVPAPAPTAPTLPETAPAVADDAIPIRLIAELHVDWLASRPNEEQRILWLIFGLVDGQRSVREIKSLLRFAPDIVEKGLIFLIAMHQISMRRRERI
ncbi:hypothetical protein ccbrp13_22870 [Ktedonobacteria bacterium brp13]|nr:hypothetical protein ccbrp13_22870 [Ktedonobacteria bacterium brp13]